MIIVIKNKIVVQNSPFINLSSSEPYLFPSSGLVEYITKMTVESLFFLFHSLDLSNVLVERTILLLVFLFVKNVV